MNLEKRLRSKPSLSFIAHQRSQSAWRGGLGWGDVRRALALFDGAKAGPMEVSWDGPAFHLDFGSVLTFLMMPSLTLRSDTRRFC